MTRPLSNDLLERVVAAVIDGESSRSVASRFGVAVSSVVKWSQRYRATGSVGPGKMGGHRKRVLEPHRAFIKERIRDSAWTCRLERPPNMRDSVFKRERPTRARVPAQPKPAVRGGAY